MQETRENKVTGPSLEVTHPEKRLPKYCTSVQVGLLNSSNLILSLSFHEPDQPGVLIERVIIDLEHADNLANVLKTAVTESQETRQQALN